MPKKRHGFEDLYQFALEVIQKSGQKALSFYGKGSSRVKFDERLVTEIELSLGDFFQSELQSWFPEHQLFAYDQVRQDYSHDQKRYLWIYDPMDGIANIQAGVPIWGISLALLENFWPVLGMFHMPVTGDLFHARAGRGAFWGEDPIRVSSQEVINDESVLLTYSRFNQHHQISFPGKVRNLGCTTAHVCYVAMGRADAAVIANESFQDLASARVLLESAGGKIVKLDGEEFFLNEYLDGRRINETLLAVAPGIRKQVAACIQ